ncbi:phage major tail tube protein [Desulfobulbus elongatus]|uniref:phage major tail tube protein n=1 Tax=Desulfobulbus elongatus TaxID=53332 RepID=UPI0004803D2F|nr:phage major tail tube protein [Desulfobulbus elongatus]
MLDDILRNFSLFVDGRGYAGNVEELTPPKLTMKTEEMRAGGMDAPVEVELGMEKMECSFTLTRYDKELLKLFGLAPGSTVPLTMRGSVESEDGTKLPVVINLRGKIKELEPGNWKPGDKATLKITVALRAYKFTHGSEVVHDIDVLSMRRVIGGVDQLLQTRLNIGL